MTQTKSTTPNGRIETKLSESQRHRLLSDERRRQLLDIFARRKGPLELDDLATELVKRAPDLETDDEATVRRIKISLYHHHLPMIADCGVIDYDSETDRVVL